ncbi:MAG: Gfo/Idh/MocA family oxidoreductase [Candidatus Latescibacteria bacterium]|nr:Gfo/Idh/MocA family oxidoreductase [Candidatus Latescibacterota bacterium]
METPRIGVVGMGGFAQTHRRYVAQVEEAALGRQVAQVAIPADQELYAADLEALRARQVQVFASLREMLAGLHGQLDIVCIPTGIPLHRPMTVMALEAGCHVLVEKPAAGSIQDFDAMEAARRRAGRFCAVGYQHLYRADVRLLKEWICAGRLGKIQWVRACGGWPRDPAYYARNSWAGRLAVGDAWALDSPHNNALAHAVNALCYLGSDQPGAALVPRRLQAELYRANPIESADTAVFRATSAEGVGIFFAVSHASDERFDPVFEVSGELGRAELDYHGGFKVWWADGSHEEHLHQGEPRVLEDLAEVVTGRRDALACPLALTRSQTLCVCGTFESSAIHELPAALRRVDPKNQGVTVEGLGELVRRACRARALFSELGVAWAQPGEQIDLDAYPYFPGFRR